MAPVVAAPVAAPSVPPEVVAGIVESMRQTLDLLNRTKDSIRSATDAAMRAAEQVHF